jgi:hypothetical protein
MRGTSKEREGHVRRGVTGTGRHKLPTMNALFAIKGGSPFPHPLNEGQAQPKDVPQLFAVASPKAKLLIYFNSNNGGEVLLPSINSI